MLAASPASQWTRRLLLLLFIVSGACGLVYQLAWMRRLALVFGSTTLAISTVLAAFMGGLALGSWWFGRRADRNPDNTLRLYGYLEIAIGLIALAIPLLFRGVAAIYLSLAPALEQAPRVFFVAQFLLIAPVIVIPTMLMGGTLPLLARYLVRRMPELTARIGALYSANTLGAAAGVLLATYVLLPGFGISSAEQAAALANLGVGGGALFLLRRAARTRRAVEPQEAPAEGLEAETGSPLETDPPSLPGGARVLLVGTALSGFAAMIYEVVWSRTLAMVLGSSVYAFGSMLVIFLFGLSIGSALFARLRGARGSALESAGVFVSTQIGISAAGLTAILLTPSLPALFLRLFPLARASFEAMQLVQLAIAGVLLLPPAILFGMAFPAVIAATAGSVRDVGAGVGRATAWNTVGTVAGAFLAGFVLVPSIGLRATLVAAAAASGAAALLAVWTLPFRRRRLRTVLTAAILVLALVSPSWPRQALVSGVGFFAGGYRSVAQWRETARAMEILFYKDGINTTLSVDRDASYRYYRSNGKTDASTYPADMAVQVLIGQIPMLFHPDPKDVFVLGLGTGVSAAAVARHPVRSIDIVDIEAAGRDAARYFEPENRNILADPRVRYRVADGRNALLAQRRTYDVIISDPSDVWVAGVGTLFTKEFYETARSRLRAGGVMGQWWHTHALHPEHMKLIVATFRSVFPYASYWRPNLGDVVMVGSAQPLPWDYTRIRAKYDTVPGLADDLRSIGLWHPLAVFAAFVLEGEDLDALLAGVRAVHTDDHPVVEFSAPRYLYQDTALLNDTLVQRPQSQPFPALANFDAARDFDPHATYLLGFGYASLNRFDHGIRWMEEAVRLAPGNAKYWIGLGNQYRGKGRTEDAEEAYRQALAASPGETEATLELSALLRARDASEEAEEILRTALGYAPEDPGVLSEAASLWIETGRPAEAIEPLRAGLTRAPGHGGLHLLYGEALAAAGKAPEALLHLRQAASLAGNDAGALRSAGESLLAAGAAAEAAAAFETAVALEPSNVPGLVGLAKALVQRGDMEGARKARDRALALSPADPGALAVSVN